MQNGDSIINIVQIDGLKIIKPLGSGYFSTVYLGEYQDTLVAIKAITSDDLSFSNETTVLQSIQGSPHASYIINDIPGSEEYPIIITKYEEGTPLSDIYTQLNIHDIKFILKDLLLCLQAVHSRQVVHQDITLYNILYSPELHQTTLIDWGCGSFVVENRMSPFNGSRLYRSPEMLIGYHNYSTKADLWAVGVVILLMITRGKFPWEAMNADKELVAMSTIFGGDTLIQYSNEVLHQPIKPKLLPDFSPNITVKIEDFYAEESKDIQDPSLIDLMNHLLSLDLNERYTAEQALQHRFLQ